MSGPGGVLTPHTDFHSYLKLKLYRRVNVLVYLTPEWRREFGGVSRTLREGKRNSHPLDRPDMGHLCCFSNR